MKRQELVQRTGVSAAEVKAWVSEGMPARGEAGEIAGWLRERGHAEAAERLSPWVARTWAELARGLGMGGKEPERVLQRLAQRPGFPGRPSRPGKRDGELPVEKIRSWLATVGHVDSVDDEELAAIKKRIALLDLEAKEAEGLLRAERLADVGDVGQFAAQVIANAKAVLASIDDEVVSLLPESVPVNVRKEFRRRVQKLRDSALEELARLAEGDTDETDDADGD